jgi:hypothetical protein
MITFETAGDVFNHAEIEYGNAIADVLLSGCGLSATPLPKAKDELAVKARALGEAARFAAKNRATVQQLFSPSGEPDSRVKAALDQPK